MKRLQLKKKINNKFQLAMMSAPPVALNMRFYEDALTGAVVKFMADNPDEDGEVTAEIQTELQEEFTWFIAEETEELVQKFGGGYFRNMNEPKKLVGKALYEVLKITNSPKEQKLADEKFGMKTQEKTDD